MKTARIIAIGGLCAAARAQTEKVRIMYLGDSITEATCWRAMIWDMLAEEGLTDKVEMTGSMTDNYMNCTTTAPGFDLHHEGHIGWQGVNISNQYLTEWLAEAQPDIVQFMLGTNDVNGGGRTTDDVINAYTKMVGEARNSSDEMRIIVDKIIPLPFNSAPIEAINEAIPAWANAQNTTKSPVYIADCSHAAGFQYDWLRDTIHPNAEGDHFIASQVGPLIIQLVKEKLEMEKNASDPQAATSSGSSLKTTMPSNRIQFGFFFLYIVTMGLFFLGDWLHLA